MQAGISSIKSSKINSLDINQEDNNLIVRKILKDLTAEEFFKYYSNRPSYENLTILTADGIVIPQIGLAEALTKTEYVYKVPTYSWLK
jgi:hypothetical protein